MNSVFDPLVQDPLSSEPAMVAAECDAAPSNAKPSPTSIGETPAAQPQSNLKTALSLALAGLFVFPCNPKKKPLVEHWREQSTSDVVQIQAWWAQHPNALVAIDCGKSGLVVIDCDRKPGCPDGVAAFKKLVGDNPGKVEPKPPQPQTPNNGVHVIFRQSSRGEPLSNSSGDLPDGIDVRGEGGYIIAPGSQLPDGRAWMAKEGALALAAGKFLRYQHGCSRFCAPFARRPGPMAMVRLIPPRSGRLARVMWLMRKPHWAAFMTSCPGPLRADAMKR